MKTLFHNYLILFYALIGLCSPRLINAQPLSPPLRCGTVSLLQTLTHKEPEGVAWKRQGRIFRYLSRPTEPGEERNGLGHTYTTTPTFYVSPSGHFKIWYVTSGSDVPRHEGDPGGIPGWVIKCAEFFDQAWAVEVDSLGFWPPPADLNYPSGKDNGGDERYDIYIENLGTLIAGYSAPEAVWAGRKLSSYIVVDNDYQGIKDTYEEALELLQATAAHEFFHAIQFGIDALEDIYWDEQSAVWMEDQVYPEVNDYLSYFRSFNGFFTNPRAALDLQDGQHEFAGALWPFFLEERFGPGMVHDIWDWCETVQSLAAFDSVLVTQASSLGQAFKEFTVWNYFTGGRYSEGSYYRESASYPQITILPSRTHMEYPIQGPLTQTQFPDHLGADYVSFLTTERVGGLRIRFDGEYRPTRWGVMVIGFSPDGPSLVKEMQIDDFGSGEITLLDWQNYEAIVLIPSVLDKQGFQYSYSYTVEFDSLLTKRKIPKVFSLRQNYPNPFYPNPFNPQTTIEYTLKERIPVRLVIYNLLGQSIRTLVDQVQDFGVYHTSWDGLDDAGRPVATGVFFYQLEVGAFVATHKMLLLR